jgi:hypothetical protein
MNLYDLELSGNCYKARLFLRSKRSQQRLHRPVLQSQAVPQGSSWRRAAD